MDFCWSRELSSHREVMWICLPVLSLGRRKKKKSVWMCTPVIALKKYEVAENYFPFWSA